MDSETIIPDLDGCDVCKTLSCAKVKLTHYPIIRKLGPIGQFLEKHPLGGRGLKRYTPSADSPLFRRFHIASGAAAVSAEDV